MGVILKNNAVSTTSTAISASDVGVAVASGTGVLFPTLGSGDYFYATLISPDDLYEIVKVTARSGDSLTIARAQEGTTARSFVSGSRIEARVTAASITDIATEAVESLALEDGVTPPAAVVGQARIYVDSTNGDLKVVFGDGTIKTIVTDS